MSYTIEYQTVFLRSANGITPCVLFGSNNVYETDRRRSRSWYVFNKLVGVSAEELEAALAEMFGSSEHWMRNGKWVDDKGLVSWFKHHMKNAQTVEQVLGANRHMGTIRCYASDANVPGLDRRVRTTKELDAWIAEYRDAGSPGFPRVDFGQETIKRSKTTEENEEEEVFLKYRGKYCHSIDEVGSSWNVDPQKAQRFTRKEAELIISTSNNPWLNSANIVSAISVLNKKEAVVKLKDGSYVYKLTSARLFHTMSTDSAKKYSSLSAAKSAAELINRRFPSLAPATPIAT